VTGDDFFDPWERREDVEVRSASLAAFRHVLARVDPNWTSRPTEEQDHWAHWYDRTARAISRQYARSFRDPSHDASDVLQEILMKLLTKFGPADAPHRLLTERPCMRNLMEWKGLDQVDWENAARRNAKRRTSLPDDDIGLADRRTPSPEAAAEASDAERSFRRAIRDPEDREAYLLFRMGRTPREVARLLGRKVGETKDLRDRLVSRLHSHLHPA
jgi:DNA-directed RNA polymerase specialized sigma24 family protein